MTEENIKETLFGRIDQKRSGDNSPAQGEELVNLAMPIDPKDGVINVFCKSHRSIAPISQEGRDALIERFHLPEPNEWTGKYFECASCPFCNDECVFTDVIMKDFRA